ncbi:MAG: regulatory iron-sulfur-containing complex subunit RicT [Pseudomonadota bacterium]
MSPVFGVKFRKKLKPVEADSAALELSIEDKVIVETENGPMLGTLVPRVSYKCMLPEKSIFCHRILRKAEDADLRQEELNIRMERDYSQVCQRKIKEQNLPMKLVEVEIETDGSKVVFYFVSENRVDFRSLVKDLAGELRTRIEMRQIGARTEAQKKGGIGCCGKELCCTTFLQKFCPVTVKMTKEQGLPLDPEKISGVCGRLMCCLAYEYDTYVELREGLPKIGKKIMTPHGQGRIKQINVIARNIVIELEDGVLFDLSTEDYNPEMLVKQPQQ